jgi:hypothetical protein
MGNSDLIILSVADEVRTRRFLLEFFTVLEMHERVRPALRHLPARFRNLDLAGRGAVLSEARHQGWFDYQVVPAGSA